MYDICKLPKAKRNYKLQEIRLDSKGSQLTEMRNIRQDVISKEQI